MSLKTIGVIFLVGLGLVLAVFMTDKAASSRYQSEIARLKGEIVIYKTEAENYAKILRAIREAAAKATVVEKAQ